MGFTHGDTAFYLPEERWVHILTCAGRPNKVYILKYYDKYKNILDFIELNEDGTLDGERVLLRYEPDEIKQEEKDVDRSTKEEGCSKMSHIFKPGDFAYWYDPKWGVNKIIELIANNEETKSTFPLIGTHPITKPLNERTQILFTEDGRILPSYPIVLFVDNPCNKDNSYSRTDECKEEKDADYFLTKAVEILKERGRERDVEKERSMARIISVYNALTGQSLSVEDGWKFMAILKLVRIQIKPHEDGFLDALSYMALWGEEAYQNNNFGGNS